MISEYASVIGGAARLRIQVTWAPSETMEEERS
jgi:hypothetical protein